VYQNGSVQTVLFLDISDRVAFGGEQGLLSIAFHPKFATNNKFYVNYVSENDVANPKCSGSNRCTIISEFTLGTTNKLEDSERIILEIAQPANNHNGGHILFGSEPSPYLYIGMGDGGGANDNFNNGQDLTTLLGAMLRIDINNKDSGLEYAIPVDNPAWEGITGARREIWAYGLRNPCASPSTLQMAISMLVMSAKMPAKRLTLSKKGGNYGWRVMEGDICTPDVIDPCTPNDYDPPIIAHAYDSNSWKSITGGVVYRGSSANDLCGVYLYGDYVSGIVRGIRYDGSNVTAQKELLSPYTANINISSFGYNENYEVYMLDYGGVLYRIIAPDND